MIQIINSAGQIKGEGSITVIDKYGKVKVVPESSTTPTLQQVTDTGNTTTKDIIFSGLATNGFIVTAADGTQKRIILVDDGFGNYSLELQTYP